VYTLLSAIAGIVVGCQGASQRYEPPNLVVVMIDTLRPDHLGLYGYERETAPFLSQLGRESAVFHHAFSSSSWTAPATASFFTGLYPNRHGVDLGFVANLRQQEEDYLGTGSIQLRRLPESISTLPQLLKRHGYATFGLATNVNIGPEIGFDRGMDRFVRERQEAAEGVFSRLMAWESEIRGSEPFFLYLHFNDVHWPYTPERQWYQAGSDSLSELVAAYDSEIRYLDEFIGRLVERFRDDRTLFVILSDHGEEFRDHGALRHGVSLYRELSQILLLFHGPGLGVPARIITTPVSIVDVLPTIFEIAGLPVPDDRDGRSVAPLWKDSADENEDAILQERPLFAHRRDGSGKRHLWSVVRGEWKLIQYPRRSELYHRFADPDELTNLIMGHPEVARNLAGFLESFRDASGDESSSSIDVPIDPKLLDELRALGYAK
jgi:arylsulfatase A-like enzyme